MCVETDAESRVGPLIIARRYSYHEVLSRARWDARTVARKLLAQVLDVFLPAGEVVIGIDDTIERRWGARIKARGIYHLSGSGALVRRSLTGSLLG